MSSVLDRTLSNFVLDRSDSRISDLESWISDLESRSSLGSDLRFQVWDFLFARLGELRGSLYMLESSCMGVGCVGLICGRLPLRGLWKRVATAAGTSGEPVASVMRIMRLHVAKSV